MTTAVDFLIIGGGIAGVSAAARLSHLGSVLVLEAEAGLGYHASGRSAAMLEVTYGLPTTVTLNRASEAYLASENGGVLSPRGLLLIDTGDTAAFEADRDRFTMQEIGFDAARDMVPILNGSVVRRAGYHADAWDIDTDLLIQNFAREARGNGGEIRLDAGVTAITRADGLWQADSAAGPAAGRMLVNAAGAWADRVAAMAGIAPLGLQPMRRSMARLPAPGGHDVSTWPMVFGPGESWYAKPDAGKLLVSPAEEDPMEPHDAWADDMVLAEGLARYEAAMTEPVTRVETSWAGLRTFAPDRQLVVGFEPERPEFLWIAGQGGYGMQTSPAVSRLAADLVAGRSPEIDAETVRALAPARFR